MPPRKVMEGKAKNFGKTFSRMIKDFKSQAVLMVFIIILAIGSAILSIITPSLLRDLLNSAQQDLIFIDTITGSINIHWDVFIYKFGVILGLYALAALFSWLSEFAAVSVSARYSY